MRNRRGASKLLQKILTWSWAWLCANAYSLFKARTVVRLETHCWCVIANGRSHWLLQLYKHLATADGMSVNWSCVVPCIMTVVRSTSEVVWEQLHALKCHLEMLVHSFPSSTIASYAQIVLPCLVSPGSQP